MQILNNISLKTYNTFGIDVKAKHFVSVTSLEELKAIYSSKNHPKKFILGGGSNILLTKDVDALVIHLDLKGKTIVSKTDRHVLIECQAGENWHDFVLWTLENNFGGLENLSLIPGNVGTSPIQNIGAYGVELKDTFQSCNALNLETLAMENFTNTDCDFGYRNSIFKQEAKGQY
ncbi:MAG: FAD-binding protein, partial [Olleya sp.]